MAQPKKIAIVGPARPFRGGIAHFTGELAGALRRRGHHVTLETFSRQYPALLFPGKTQLEPDQGDLPEDTIAQLDSINPLTWRSTGNRIRREAYDLVVFSYWLSFFAPAYASVARRARRSGSRIISLVHNAVPHRPRPGDRMLSRYWLRRCDSLLTLSSAVRDDIRSLGVSAPILETGHPVYTHFGEAVEKEEARRVLGLPPEVPVLLFFGFIRNYKGLDVLIDAMPRVLRDLPDAQLMVAGEFYEDETLIRKRSAQSGIGPNVRFDTRYIPDERVKLYFSAADLVVQPYRSATQSGVAHVAFHFSRPVVVTNVGGLAETVPHGEAGFVVPPEHPEALAGSITNYFSDPELRNRLDEGARRQHGVFSWEALAAELESQAPSQQNLNR